MTKLKWVTAITGGATSIAGAMSTTFCFACIGTPIAGALALITGFIAIHKTTFVITGILLLLLSATLFVKQRNCKTCYVKQK